MNDEKTPLVPPRYLKPHSWLKRNCCPCIPARYVLAVMSSLGFVNVYALRVNLSVAIVEMSNDTATLRNGSARVNKQTLVTFGLFRPQTIQGSLGLRPIEWYTQWSATWSIGSFMVAAIKPSYKLRPLQYNSLFLITTVDALGCGRAVNVITH